MKTFRDRRYFKSCVERFRVVTQWYKAAYPNLILPTMHTASKNWSSAHINVMIISKVKNFAIKIPMASSRIAGGSFSSKASTVVLFYFGSYRSTGNEHWFGLDYRTRLQY